MVETILTNPGIIDRLEQDITDYLSPFGYSIERHEIDETVSSNANNNKCNNKSKCNRAVLTSPSLPDDGPICTLHLHIHNESLIPTIGPLLRTYLRLSSPSISPIKLRSILHCNFTLDPIQKYTKMNTTQQNQVLKQQEELSAKKIVQYIHMIIRNSMGSALCIELVVVLPCYWNRRVDTTTDESSRSGISISTESVRQAMQNNPDSCYPSVQLVEQSSEGNIDRDDNNTCLHLNVKTRMCTVRHQPLLFRWLSTLDGSISNDTEYDASIEIQQQRHDRRATPLIVACIEKVANLHRILMLLYDYDKSEDDNSSSLFSRVVIVLPNNIEKDKTLSEFNEAIDNFHKVIIDEQEDFRRYRPTLVYEDQAVEKISYMIDIPLSDQSSIIGIDLHPKALTLNGDYRRQPSPALQLMRDADAIVFGYESTGIPEVVSKILNSWVQIPSRSSINVVAAMSIILDALMDKKV